MVSVCSLVLTRSCSGWTAAYATAECEFQPLPRSGPLPAAEGAARLRRTGRAYFQPPQTHPRPSVADFANLFYRLRFWVLPIGFTNLFGS